MPQCPFSEDALVARVVFNVNNDSQKLGDGHRQHEAQQRESYVEARNHGAQDYHTQRHLYIMAVEFQEHSYFIKQQTESN